MPFSLTPMIENLKCFNTSNDFLIFLFLIPDPDSRRVSSGFFKKYKRVERYREPRTDIDVVAAASPRREVAEELV